LHVQAQNQFQIRGLVAVKCADNLPNGSGVSYYTGRFIMFSVITNIYNKKTPNAYAEPSTLLYSTSIAP
jgi:hypothetical protein